MRILVPIKCVVDHNVKVRVKADGAGVELANVKMSMNPFDDILTRLCVSRKRARPRKWSSSRLAGRGCATKREG
jgi:electron transfer flavoprotein beta subunit